MTNYTIWADTGTGANKIYDIGNYLKKCAGGSVKVLGIGPNVGQSYGLHSGKGTVGVFMTNGVGLATPNDFELGCKPGGYYQYERCIFVWPQYIGNQWMSNENIMKHSIPGEWDWNRSASYNVGGQTATQWFPNAKYVDLVAGTSPQDIAQRICNGAFVTSSGNPDSSTSTGGGSSGGGSGSGSGNGQSSEEQSNTSPLLDGEMTFEELVGEICNGIDLLFLCKRSTVVVTDFETIFAEAKYLRDNKYSAVSDEDIKLWQLEEDSYELDINQHGFYNTVYIEYDKGKVKESFDDLVKVYGEVPITYTDRKLDKSSAIMKAKAYLAAHMRDLELTVNGTIISQPNIDIGDIVTLNNPHTKQNDKKKSPEFLFVKGINTSWEGDGYIESDIEMQFSPTSPEKREVPTHGTKNCGSPDDTTESSGGNMVFNSCGVSSDNKYVLSISQPSAGRMGSYSYNTTYATIFENKCPRCGQPQLKWDSGLSGANCITCGGYHGSKSSWGDISESEVSCNACCSDFCGTTGWEKDGAYSSRLSTYKSPVPIDKEEKHKLMRGNYSL